MQTKHILIGLAVVAVFVLVSWLRLRSGSAPPADVPQAVSLAELTDGERHVYSLLREVQGHAILTESFVRERGDVKAQLILDTNKTAASSLKINLTNLAQKQKDDGLSDETVKRGFAF